LTTVWRYDASFDVTLTAGPPLITSISTMSPLTAKK
jgi:hypothetical protein